MAGKEEVAAYLLQVRELVRMRSVVFLGRPKNIEALRVLGMSRQAVLHDLASLTVEHYSSGPEADRDREGQRCWVFGRSVGECEVYIKLVVEALSERRQRLKVLSFHQAERSLRYPFRVPPLGGV